MRRAAVTVMVGCAFGGIVSGVGHQRDISGVRLTAAIQSITNRTAAKAAAPAMKTVEYRGYAIRVPATWPVYSLSKDPAQCVRYDVNAVYLGTPGPNPDCPAHVVGRADTVSIGGPATPGQGPTPVRTDLRAALGAKRAGTGVPAAPGTIMANTQLRELSVAMPDSAPAITATYGTSPDEIMQVLAGVHQITQQSAPTGTVVAASAVPQARPNTPAPPRNPALPNNPAPPSAPPPPVPAGALTGFDTCGAPSLATMKAWRAKYAAAAIYIGGQEMGCGYGN